MSNKKQTAVEIAFEWFDNIIPFVNNEKAKEFNDKKIQLKAMEKEQIINAFWNGDNSDCTSEQNSFEFAEQYYLETYEQQKTNT